MSAGKPVKEKRREQRVPVDLWIEAEREGELYYQRASNLSVGGAFFAQTIPLPLGTRVSLRFTLPGDAQEISCAGEIVTAKDLGMGVQFLDLQAADRARIERLVARLTPKAKG
jgi:type IV pilus assembly protein PilZ